MILNFNYFCSEKARSEELLSSILPQFIVDQLKNNIPVVPEVNFSEL